MTVGRALPTAVFEPNPNKLVVTAGHTKSNRRSAASPANNVHLFLRGTCPFLVPRPATFVAAAGLILCVSLVATYRYFQALPTDVRIAEFGDADFEMLDHIDLVENFDLIRNMELLSDFEIIEGLDEMDA